ncbi:hypothetical protein ACIP2X_10360 [Streptomyces sp. NPDC089424]|uniref:hypothetical protein n=1 Tax=Streptomyces sp. NPDC089424 TaxID=3365917 RepID=UPI0038274204
MARRSLTQRLVLLLAPTALAAGGVLMPSSALAAPAPPHLDGATATVAPLSDHGDRGTAPAAVNWVRAVDSSSGISFALPGKSTPKQLEAGGLHGRVHTAPTSDGFVYFLVVDVKGAGPAELEAVVEGTREGLAEEYGDTTFTGQKPGTRDGRPSLDAHLTNARNHLSVETTQTLTDDHVVQVVTVGSQADEKAVTRTHEQAVDSLRIP